MAVRELRHTGVHRGGDPLAAFKRVQHHAATGGHLRPRPRAAVEARGVEEHRKVFDAAQGLAAHGKRKRVSQRDLALALRTAARCGVSAAKGTLSASLCSDLERELSSSPTHTYTHTCTPAHARPRCSPPPRRVRVSGRRPAHHLLEEAAYCDQPSEVVVPLLSMSKSVLLCISTLLESGNHYSKMFNLKDSLGRQLFEQIQITLVCEE